MPKRALTTTKEYLINAALPSYSGDTYTVIPHEDVIKATIEQLHLKGFQINTELYRCSDDAQVAQGIYYLNSDKDPEIGMMFAWSNSYDKSMRFRCAVGGYVFICMNGIVAGDMATWGRKHTGTADTEMVLNVHNQLADADTYFADITSARDSMKLIDLSRKQQAELIGVLYAEEEIITQEQCGIIKSQMKDPSYDYNCSRNTLWTFYNHVTHALKKCHPRDWLSQQRAAHMFFNNNFITKTPVITGIQMVTLSNEESKTILEGNDSQLPIRISEGEEGITPEEQALIDSRMEAMNLELPNL